MKNKLMKLLLLGMTGMFLAACSGDKNDTQKEESTQVEESVSAEEGTEEIPTIYFEDIAVDDYVTLGEYKGLEVIQNKAEVTEEELESFIQYSLSSHKHTEPVTDRDVVENGDVANIDYEGKKDGVAFEGGTAAGYDLEIGSGSFIPGFEEGLVGAKVGEIVDLNLTFPDNYPSEELAGQEVVFTVTVNSISAYVTHELNDEFVQELAIEGVTTVDQFREYAREGLQAEADSNYHYNLQMQLISLAMQNAQIKEPPTELVEKYKKVTTSQLEYQAAMYGVDIETFVQGYFGVDLPTYEKEIEAGALETAKQALLCYKIALEENLQVTEEEMNTKIEESYAAMGYTSADSFKEMVDLKEYKDSMLLDKVFNFLIENAKVTEQVESLQ
ncbi:MAG: trigger factor [Lachnospiraceae bacterium]|nr:trigger factor [Lachnospiraceae bacterium]